MKTPERENGHLRQDTYSLLKPQPTEHSDDLENISHFLYQQNIQTAVTGQEVSHMKDKQVMQRFNQYLNRAFFANQDPFIKKKHELYMKKKGE
jgi:hypothetical protein